MRFFCFLLCIFLIAQPAQALEERWYLRVIAQDDSPAAQAEKIALRDQLLPLFPAQAADLPHALPRIIQTAQAHSDCTVEIKKWSPHAKTPPAPTVYITIGSGSGQNWWGLLYQGACLMAQEPEDAPAALDGEIQFTWPFFRWLKAKLSF